ncbi:MAG: acetyltransferase [Solirubrobacteraceae bacterium]|nr:acetyltransferase [Solirubrobacteraceae bacterium]
MSWRATLAGTAATIAAHRLELDRDLPLVRGWMNAPHVAPWWGLAGPIDVTERYLREQLARPHLHPWIVCADGEPFAYAETYRAADDPLAEHYDADPGDRGFHLLVGPPDRLGTGAAQLLIRALLAHLLADPAATRVVCEPDVRNTRMLRCCAALGAVDTGVVRLPDKDAALLVWTRADVIAGDTVELTEDAIA